MEIKVKKLHDTHPAEETAVLVAVRTIHDTIKSIEEELEELKMLTETAGAKTLKTFTQAMTEKNSKFFVGPGKMDEIVAYITENKVDNLIFNDELTPSQIRNIEKVVIVECKILDRTNLILDIFANNAKTAQSKTQVDLAQCEYLLPRLTRMWTHLSRQKGGIGMKGPGEKEIETDRRILRMKISLLKDKLKDFDQQHSVRVKSRDDKMKVALVGYTNAGKSTVMNVLSKADVLAENKLFATLDTTVRKMFIDGYNFLLSDTVGFIRKLPHNLVESFRSTLSEVIDSDILLHIVDISNPEYELQIQAVHDTLKEIGVTDRKMIYVFNKVDMLNILDGEILPDSELFEKIHLLEQSFLAKKYPDSVFISAQQKENMEGLRGHIVSAIKEAKEAKFGKSPETQYENQGY